MTFMKIKCMALFPLTIHFYWSHWAAGSTLPVSRGSPGQFPPIIYSNQTKYGPKFLFPRGFYSQESESLFTSTPLDMVMYPPPTLARFISPLHVGIGTFLNVGACCLPQGVPSHWPFFILLSQWCNIMQTTSLGVIFCFRWTNHPCMPSVL